MKIVAEVASSIGAYQLSNPLGFCFVSLYLRTHKKSHERGKNKNFVTCLICVFERTLSRMVMYDNSSVDNI